MSVTNDSVTRLGRHSIINRVVISCHSSFQIVNQAIEVDVADHNAILTNILKEQNNRQKSFGHSNIKIDTRRPT